MIDYPLALDLCSGLGGWADGLEAEGWDVIRVDIADMFASTSTPKPPNCLLVVQDIRTFHGSQAKDCQLIVASPPCTEFSWMSMPWSRAKQVARALRGEDEFPANYRGSRTIEELTALFDACFRIQREACEAAGRHIPMVVENVRGANPWVGRSRWNFGSFHLWGDVPALMPTTFKGFKSSGMNWSDQTKRGQDFTRIAGRQAAGTANGTIGRLHMDGLKRPGISFAEEGFNVMMARQIAPSLKGSEYCRTENDKRQHIGINRKAASAMIAKIPLPLSRHIARVYARGLA